MNLFQGISNKDQKVKTPDHIRQNKYIKWHESLERSNEGLKFIGIKPEPVSSSDGYEK